MVRANGEKIEIMTLPSGGFKSVEINIKKQDRIYFIPLVPAFQEVELIFGKKSYEIPPKI